MAKLNKQVRNYILIGIGCYLVFLLVSLPAGILANYVLPSIDATKKINLQNVQGTVWRGKSLQARVQNFKLGKLDWDLSVWSLLLGKIRLDVGVSDDQHKGSGDIAIGLGGSLDLEDVDFRFPAETLMPLFYGFPIAINGNVLGRINSAELEPGEILKADGRVIWQGAGLTAPQNMDLGDFVVQMKPQNTGTHLIIKDQNSPVKTDLVIEINGNGQYHVKGSLAARDSRRQDISAALRLLPTMGWSGRTDQDGKFQFNHKGKLRNWKS